MRLTDQELVGGDDSHINFTGCEEGHDKHPVNLWWRKIRRHGDRGPFDDVLTQAMAWHMGNKFDELALTI